MRARINHYLDIAQDIINDIKIKLGLAFGKYKSYNIVEPGDLGSPVFVFKPETQETVKLMRVFGFIEEGDFTITYPELDVWCFENAEIIGRNDFIIKGNNVFWDKINHFNFSKNIALDYNLISHNNESLIVKETEVEKHFDVAFSLLGVHATIWSHSLSEYFTKISAIAKVFEHEKGNVKVLVPYYNDKQLKQVMFNGISKYDHVEIVPIADGERVQVDKLYYLPRPTMFTDHETYVAIGDDIQPKIVSDIIKRDLVEDAVKGAKDLSFPKKLFLIRRATHRVLSNNEEVESFFQSQGFFLLEPSKLDLKEKIKYFYNADEIVGPFSSAFSNLIFSKPGTKVLMFSNYQRIFENWLSMHYQYFNIDMWFVTGYDLSKNNSAHTNFYVSIDRIKAACKKVGIIIS